MNFSLFGADLFGDPIRQVKSGALARRFEFPPFSVLDARSGEWQERKRAWLSLGIRGEEGRARFNYASAQAADLAGGYRASDNQIKATSDSSVFDPALCELAYHWFCPPGGTVLDPFAGGSVRGVVAALLGFKYWGSELRAEQVEANREQGATLCQGAEHLAWVCGDSRQTLTDAPLADFLFTCPPYGDLERYSDDPADLSAMSYPDFLAAYREIIKRAAERLKPNRFACLVVGEFRDKKSGAYRGFVADTVKAAGDAGLAFYNDAILLTSVGSLAIRSGKVFQASRKLGKAHQNVLVFVKGSGALAAKACCAGEP